MESSVVNLTRRRDTDRAEWLLARLLLAHQLVWRPELALHSQLPFPIGWAQLFNCSIITSSTASLWALDTVRIVAVLLYIQGRFLLPSIGVLLTCGALAFTVHDSQGAVDYLGQMSHLILLGQGLGLLEAWFQKHKFTLPSTEYDNCRFDNFFKYSQIMALLIYFNSAITKLRTAGLDWIWSGPNVALQIVKSFHMQFYNSLDPSKYQEGISYSQWALTHPELIKALLATGLILELLGICALTNRRLLLWTGLAFLALHESIRITMQIHFYVNELIAIVFLIRAPRVVGLGWARLKEAFVHLAKAPNPHPRSDDTHVKSRV